MKIDYAARDIVRWKDTELADALSNMFLWYPLTIAIIFWHSWWLAGAYALTFGLSQLVKRLTDRARPDGSDNHSFFSGHTSTAFVAVGFCAPLFLIPAMLVGYLRMAANKHWLTDVAAGALVGALMGGLAQWLK